MSLETATIRVFVSTAFFDAAWVPEPLPSATEATAAAATSASPDTSVRPGGQILRRVRCCSFITLLLVPPSCFPARSSGGDHVQIARQAAERGAAVGGHVDDLLEPDS